MLTTQELSYLAGLFDGEGHAGIAQVKAKTYPDAKKKKRSAYKVPSLQLKMTDPEPVEAFHHAFPSSFCEYRLPSGKSVYCWCVSHQKALQAARALFPFLRNGSKRAQVKLILDHYQEAV